MIYLIRRVGGLIGGILDRAFCTAGALIFSQIPAFMAQYLTLLKGALHESRIQVEALQQRSSALGKSIEAFIEKHLSSSDPDFSASGRLMQETFVRYNAYRDAVQDLEHSTIWQKPFYFIYHLDWNLLKEMKFIPGIPFTVEAGIYAVAGIIFGYIIYTVFIWAPFQLIAPVPRRRVTSRNA